MFRRFTMNLAHSLHIQAHVYTPSNRQCSMKFVVRPTNILLFPPIFAARQSIDIPISVGMYLIQYCDKLNHRVLMSINLKNAIVPSIFI